MEMPNSMSDSDEFRDLVPEIRIWAKELGFADVRISGIDLATAESRLTEWLAKGFHGEMDYMSRHGTKRTRPGELLPGTRRVITARMDYLPENQADAVENLEDPNRAYIARYALGRDYHKVLRKRLAKLAARLADRAGPHGWRVFTDSAPVLEKPIAEAAGIGWIGKHTNVIQKDNGSWFFLGEIFTDLPLPVDSPASEHCGSCRACIDVCPTGAIVEPWQLDARRCISYLTIELHGAIPVELRPLIGNRVFGCDDCQLFCPWNKFASVAELPDFKPRHGLDRASLLELFSWSESEFDQRTLGSAIRRIGYERWLRNLAVAIGNAPPSAHARKALERRLDHESELVREHVRWALDQHAAASRA
jgi:epoxyqueuosine reductase